MKKKQITTKVSNMTEKINSNEKFTKFLPWEGSTHFI
jgi:hypothetical protein